MSQREKPEASGQAANPAEKEKEVRSTLYYSWTDQCIQFKPMRFGDPPQYPLPKIDGNPFTLLLEPRIAKGVKHGRTRFKTF